MKRILLLVACAALFAACGSTAVDGEAGDVGDRTTYPDDQPYGTKQGSIIANLAFETADGEPISLHDIRTDESVRVMLLSSMAGWCQPCIIEQEHFKELQTRYGSRGFKVVSAMFEDTLGNVPTPGQVQEWKTQYKLNYLFLRDLNYVLRPYYSGDPPMNMVVDVDTMEIVYLGAGYDAVQIENAIKSNLPAEE